MIGVCLASQTDIAGWRAAARRLRLAGVAPQDVLWSVGDVRELLDVEPPPRAADGAGFSVPASLLDLAGEVLLHRSASRWALMYRILWRLGGEGNLLSLLTDPDVDAAGRMRKAVRHAEHKMHAFVRFRRVDDPQTDETEAYAAWFEPAHYVLEAAAPFFARRMGRVPFSILTPDAVAIWDGVRLSFGGGADRSQAPAQDACESDWKAYFASVFNPARLNPRVMTQHMPKAYWRNLPEAALIPNLVAAAAGRAEAMVQSAPTSPSPLAGALARRRPAEPPPRGPEPAPSLEAIAAALQGCRGCGLWRDATQAVAGEGPVSAELMFVGEQPGDLEDLRGQPFVGPAGEVFDRALAEAGIERETCYVTNAVKHFKHELRGKRRLHKTPGPTETRACGGWLSAERRLVKPRLIVALGATAAAAVFGRPVHLGKMRGRVMRLDDGAAAMATFHPSYLLRLPDEVARRSAYAALLADFRQAAAALACSSAVHAQHCN